MKKLLFQLLLALIYTQKNLAQQLQIFQKLMGNSTIFRNKEVFVRAIGNVFLFEDTNKKEHMEILEKINFSDSNTITIIIESSSDYNIKITIKTDDNSASFSDLKHFQIFGKW